jgi:omega-hydroxy-beta-dihydromenaquinone-9 sulfotransferase
MTMTIPATSNGQISAYPVWAFRMWHGMTLGTWLGLLARNRFAVSPRRSLMLIDVTIYAMMNSVFSVLQHIIYGRKINRTAIAAPPVFIIGHWRTGTTWLHEMLALDPRFVAPTTYECLASAHALVTAPVSALSRFRVPERRPMDGMPLSWEAPQEDELAVMNLGAGSFFETFAFPNRRPVRADYIELTKLNEKQRRKWIAARIYFMKQVLYRRQCQARRSATSRAVGRLLLKSPADTARLGLLCSLFPQACFIHLVRNPTDIFASSTHFWKSLAETQSLQVPDWDSQPDGTPSIDEFVLMTFERLYRNFELERHAIPAQQIIDVRYEDMVRDPLGVIAGIYDHFGWNGFADVKSLLQAYARKTSRCQRKHELPPRSQAVVAARWRDYGARYGYGVRAKPAHEVNVI